MLFNSIQFAVFFAAVLLAYRLVPRRHGTSVLRLDPAGKRGRDEQDPNMEPRDAGA